MTQAITINRTFEAASGATVAVSFEIHPDWVVVKGPHDSTDVAWTWIDDADALIGNFGSWEVCLFAQMVKQLARINEKKEDWLELVA